MRRSLERILVDDMIPYFGDGNLVCEERLEAYYEALAGPKGRAMHLLGKLVSRDMVREYPVKGFPDQYRGAIYGEVLFASRANIRDGVHSSHPVVKADRFRAGDVLTITADIHESVRSARLAYVNGVWTEVQFLPEGDIMLRRSMTGGTPELPNDANCKLMNQVADAIRIAERKPFIQ